MTNTLILAISLAILCLGTFWYNHYTNVLSVPQPSKQIQALDDSLKKVPVFAFETIHGTNHSIEDLEGKIVLLNFWATWCPPCIRELPAMLELAAHNENITLIAVSNDITKESLDRFLAKQDKNLLKHNDIYIVFDKQKAITQDLFQTYKLPETIIIDAQGIMRKKVVGFFDWENTSVDELLAQ